LLYADALRAAAIFAVVLHHVVFLTRPTIGHHRPYELGYLGVWGVNCFFVLSGYLLGRPYIACLLDPKRPAPSTKLFYFRRFLRIYPAYAAAIVFSIVAVYATYRSFPSLANIGAHLLMLQTAAEDFATSLNGPLWTMSVDIEFYLLLPLCAAGLSLLLRGRSERQRVICVLAALALLFMGSIVFRYVILWHVPVTIGDFAAAVVYERNVIGFAGTFALGMLLALYAIVYRDRTPQRPMLFGALVIAGLIIAALQLGIRMDAAPPGPPSFSRVIRLTFSEALAAISVSLIFFGLSEGGLPFFTRLTGTRFVASAAALSYAVYLVHWPIIDGISSLMHRPQGLKAFFEVGAISAVIVAVCAYLLHAFVERPFLSIKNNMREGAGGGTMPLSPLKSSDRDAVRNT
jgi:peptidoglycan/LPS O-acetylase OafA/YrhL